MTSILCPICNLRVYGSFVDLWRHIHWSHSMSLVKYHDWPPTPLEICLVCQEETKRCARQMPRIYQHYASEHSDPEQLPMVLMLLALNQQ